MDKNHIFFVELLITSITAWRYQELENKRTSLVLYGMLSFFRELIEIKFNINDVEKKQTKAQLKAFDLYVGELELIEESILKMNGTLSQRLNWLIKSNSNKNIQKKTVQLITLHSSKGMEADNVWIMACEEGILPHHDSALEEERRLMYVGMTRAKEKLYFSFASELGCLSRFIEESGI